ncbi:KaiB domain-containing protein [Thiorhodovibrio frisius]|uniref:KaiB domain-containing protein n=2 Tax=Thiorhodovibrio frisius TaxID=631362 RepID=H8Z3C2_9GAMM|nr:circadian clock KaiB family protein [Thiorhodovibrio frisius]EIC21830.1 KaiB domain-containing protein [Thiorhodovibrio frisius]WPL21798.1 Circadian clock protein KaiB [Thiorhodovibrio frisius]
MSAAPAMSPPESNAVVLLRLYVAGQSPKSVAAYGNLTRLCEQRLAAPYRIEVIDLLENPERAREDQILAIPTLVRRQPEPMRRVIGDLSDGDRVLLGLDIPVTPATANP